MHRGLEPAWRQCESVRSQLLAAVESVPAADWVRVQALHEEHHLRQFARILKP